MWVPRRAERVGKAGHLQLRIFMKSQYSNGETRVGPRTFAVFKAPLFRDPYIALVLDDATALLHDGSGQTRGVAQPLIGRVHNAKCGLCRQITVAYFDRDPVMHERRL